jgi:hypothetical protein
MITETILEGVFALSVIIAGCSIGYLSIRTGLRYESKAVKRTLAINGAAIISMALVQVGHSLDFIFILLTGTNLEPYLNGFLSYIPAGPILVCGLYVGSKLMTPEHTKHITIITIAVAIWYTVQLTATTFLSPASIYSIEKYNPTALVPTMVDTSLKVGSFPFLMFAGAGLAGFVFNGLGFLRIAWRSPGDLKRDNAMIGAGWILWLVFAVADALAGILAILMLSRILQTVSFILIFFGLLWRRL